MGNDLQNLRNEFVSDSKSLEKDQSEFSILQATKEKVVQEIKPELSKFEKTATDNIKQDSNSKFFVTLGIVSIPLLMTTLLAAALTASVLFYALATVTGLLAVVSWIKRYNISSRKGNLAAEFETLRLRAASYNISADNIEGLLQGTQKFMDNFELKSTELQKKLVANKTLESRIRDLESNGIAEIEQKIADQGETIQRIMQSVNVTSLEDYSNRLQSKLTFEGSIGEQTKVLESLFGSRGKTLEEKLVSLEAEVESLSDFENKATNMQFNEKELATIRERQTVINSKQKEIDEQLEQIRAEMCGIANKANGILRSSEVIECSNLADLDATKKMIEGFISEKETTKKNVLEAMKIFSEIESEEQGKVKDLFGEKSSISNYFAEITNGMYTHVYLDPETGNVQVERKNGEKLLAQKLSSGTFDQLYLSIRLALGEKLLKGGRGFFILERSIHQS